MVRLHASNRIKRWQESTRLDNKLRFLVTQRVDLMKGQPVSFEKKASTMFSVEF